MKNLPCEIQICMISILFIGAASIELIHYENQINNLRDQIIQDKIYYQTRIDSLQSVIEDINQYKYHFNETSDEELIDALIQIESNGNDNAYTASEDAVGCLQIRRTMVKDVNRILKRQGSEQRYEFKDRWCRQKSIEMFNIYRDYYNLKTPEEVARCWNGGPKGIYKPATVAYWKKVKNHLDS
jgi:hypothetical protein